MNEKMANSYTHLAQFPTNIQIMQELDIPESQANELAEFAGMKTTSVMAPISTPASQSTATTHFSDDISDP